MADLKLKRVTIRNWMRYGETEITFPDSGLVLVSGINKASSGKMASCGSGKTAIGEAICRTLLGSKGRYTQARSYSRDRKGDSYVRVETEHRGVPLVVESGYKSKILGGAGEALRYKYGDKDVVERSRMEETRNEIAAILGVTPLLSNWSVFIRGKKIEFSDLSQEDAVNLVMSSLAQPPWTQYFERSKTLVGNFKNQAVNDKNNSLTVTRQIAEAKNSVAVAEQSLADEENVYKGQRARNDARIEEINGTIAKLRSGISTNEARIKEIGAEQKKLEKEKAVQQHALEIERNEIDDKINAVNARKEKAVEKRSTAKNALDNATAVLDDLKGTPKECPTCNKPWDKAHSEEEISKQSEKVEKAKSAHTSAQEAVTKITAEATALQTARRTVNEKISNLGASEAMENLRDECAELERLNRSHNSRIHSAELEIVGLKKDVSDAPVQAAKATVIERKKQLADLEVQLTTLAQSIAENESALKIVSYWNKAFGPTGIPNLVLSEAIEPMNSVAKMISMRLTGGTIQVNYAVTKQLATGASKAELIINVKNEIGSSELSGNSNGESALTNFIVEETLSEIGSVSNRVGFRWYDEVLDGMDSTVRASVLTYLKEVAHRLGILVFIVDHHSESAAFADHILQVVKTKVGTTVAWI